MESSIGYSPFSRDKHAHFSFLLCLIMVGSALLLLTLSSCAKKIEVPKVTGMTVAEAMSTLEDAGFSNIEVVDKDGKKLKASDVKDYKVKSQDPKKGEGATEEATITLRLSETKDNIKRKAVEREQTRIEEDLDELKSDSSDGTTGTEVIEYLEEEGYKAKLRGADESDDLDQFVFTDYGYVNVEKKTAEVYLTSIEELKAKEEEEAQREAERQAASDANKELRTRLDSMVGGPALSNGKALEAEGYTVTYTWKSGGVQDGKDWTDNVVNDADDAYTIVGIGRLDAEKKIVTFQVAGADSDISAEQSATNTIEKGYAWIAVEHYGEDMYPYGFKVHDFAGVISETHQGDGSWVLKANCDVTNAYGATAKTVVEAHVSGTNDNPVVTEFHVY